MIREPVGLAVSVGVCMLTAYFGSLLTRPAIPGWYAALNKPPWNPPDWVFAPVWTTLYLMMAVAAWLVWREHGFQGATRALALFGIQLLLNIAWSALFFRWRMPGVAFAEILVLWILILATLLAFWRLNTTAGWLLTPYLAWVSFAAALNFAIWRLNAA